jgi:hypothetical protein
MPPYQDPSTTTFCECSEQKNPDQKNPDQALRHNVAIQCPLRRILDSRFSDFGRRRRGENFAFE